MIPKNKLKNARTWERLYLDNNNFINKMRMRMLVENTVQLIL